MSDWKPIETAPKDGTPILLFRDGKTGLGFIDPRKIGDAEWFNQSASWVGIDDWTKRASVVLGGYDPLEATHWMKLPEPPNA